MMLVYWIILCSVIVICGIGCMIIIRKNVLRYGIIFSLSVIATSLLCLFFFYNNFYRFVLPLPFILPAVSVSFGFLILFIIRFAPLTYTFPFFFMTLNIVFGIEIFFKDFVGFIHFKNSWDAWDSYSLYWVYARTFDFLGRRIVPIQWRNPIDSETKGYWLMFGIVLFLTFIVFGYILDWWL
jgi:hypothetical protein